LAETKIQPAGEELTETTAKSYEFELRDISIERLEYAFNRASRECKFFPKPFEIRQLSTPPELVDAAYQTLKERFEQAYQKARQVTEHNPEGAQVATRRVFPVETFPSVLDMDPSFGAPHGKRRQEYIAKRSEFLLHKALEAAGGKEQVMRRLLAGENSEADEAVFELMATADNSATTKETVVDPARLEMLRQQARELERRARVEDPDYDKDKNREAWLAYRPSVDDGELTGLS
jgi:hypothetical protein